jgi:hypothetical protein
VLADNLVFSQDTSAFDAWDRMRGMMTPEEQEGVLSGKLRARIIK